MTISNRNPHFPFNVARLVRLCRTWDFGSELDELEGDDGEPFSCRAIRRTKEAMRTWRDGHEPDADPLFDDSMRKFHVNDVAALLYECRRLSRLERRVLDALGPPYETHRLNRKTGKMERDENNDDGEE